MFKILKAYFICSFLFVTGLTGQNADYFISQVEHPALYKRNITAIAQDGKGFIWLGSDNGLMRFDGRSVVTISTGTGADRRDVNNPIHDIYPAPDGTLWLALERGGLAKVDPFTLNLSYVYPPHIDPKDRVWVDLHVLLPIGESHLLAGSYSESVLYIIDTEQLTFETVLVGDEPGFSEFAVNDILKTSDGYYWVGTDLAGIIVFDSDFKKVNHHYNDPTDPGSLYFNSIRSMSEDRFGNIWVATYAGGLNIFEVSTQSFSRPESLYFPGNPVYFGNTYDILINEHDEVWVATDDGLLVMDLTTRSVIHHFISVHDGGQGLVNNQVRTILNDDDNSIWIGNEYGGIHRIIRGGQFTHLAPEPGNPTALQHPIVRAVMMYDDNEIWVGMQNGGVSVLNASTLKVVRPYLHNPSDPNTISNNGVTHLYRDPDGGVWVGTWGGGLNYIDLHTDNITRYRSHNNDPNTISDDRIQFVFIDSKGRYWVGTELGLNLFDRTAGTFTRYIHEPENPGSISSNSLQTLAFTEDTNNIFWIGTWYGLNKFNAVTGEFSRFIADPRDLSTLSSNHVLSIVDTQDGFLWLGTFGGGLIKFDKNNESVVDVYFSSDGLPSNVIFGILRDQYGYLWLSTNNGLTRFDPQTGSVSNYAIKDGVKTPEFWWGAAAKGTDGRLLFGSTFGITMFDPSFIEKRASVPEIVIHSLKAFDQNVPLNREGVIELSYQQNFITIDFVAIEYDYPERIHYAYMLEGVDPGWIYPGNNTTVTYSSLPGGVYTFRVRSTNIEGAWTDRESQLILIIKPPFWQTIWFYILLILCAAAVTLLIIHKRTKSISRRNKLLQELVDERTEELKANQEQLLITNSELTLQAEQLRAKRDEIEKQYQLLESGKRELNEINDQLIKLNEEKNSLLGIVAHDLRSPLVSMTSALELIRMQPDLTNDEIREFLQVIRENVGRQLEMINRILDMEAIDSGKLKVNLQNVAIQKYLQQAIKDHEPLAHAKNIKIIAPDSMEKTSIIADPIFLNQVFANLLSNAIKFSPMGSDITVTIQKTSSTFCIGISDNGPGISEDDQKNLFGRFKKLSARPTAGESSTGLGLSIVKKFMLAMDGNVWCESKLGTGSTFWVEFVRIHDSE